MYELVTSCVTKERWPMEIRFNDKGDYKACKDGKKGMKRAFNQLATKIEQRLNELMAAPSLGTISKLPPPRCHELTGDKKGSFTVDLNGPFRLMFKPDYAEDEVLRLQDGGLNLDMIEKVLILHLRTLETHE